MVGLCLRGGTDGGAPRPPRASPARFAALHSPPPYAGAKGAYASGVDGLRLRGVRLGRVAAARPPRASPARFAALHSRPLTLKRRGLVVVHFARRVSLLRCAGGLPLDVHGHYDVGEAGVGGVSEDGGAGWCGDG